MTKVLLLTTTLTWGLLGAPCFSPQKAQTAQVLQAKEKEITLYLSTGEITREKSPENESEVLYALVGASKDMLTPGAPELPIIEKLVRVPNRGKVSLQIIEESRTPFEEKAISPYQLPISHAGTRAPFAYREELYAQKIYPAQSVSLVSVERLGAIRVARLHYTPVQYLPQEKRSELIADVTVKITISSEKGQNEVQQAKKRSQKMRPFYEKVLNMGNLNYRADEAVPTYLFIGNSQTLAQVDTLIKWKTQKGLQVITKDVSEIGATTSQIDQYIESTYDEAEGELFVLLCGDEDIIPTYQMYCPYSSVASPSDNAYGVIGSGYNPSIYVGRITHGAEDISAYGYQAWKIVMHESNPEEGAWMTKAMTWGCSQPNGDPTASYWQKQLQNAGLTCSKELESMGAKKAAQLVNSFNAGLSTFSMKGHGNDQSWHSAKIGIGYGNASVETMDIGGRFCWVNNIACLNSRFQYSSYTCFAEQMMATGSIGDAKGCLGMYSFTVSSSGGSPTQASDGMLSALYDGLFNRGMNHVGLAAAYGTMTSGTSGDKQSSMIWGCPETDIYFQYPLTQFEPQITPPTPGQSYTVSAGVANALVSLITTDYTLLASGYTDAQGEITLELPAYESATVLTITGRNCKPSITNFDKVSLLANAKDLTGNKDLCQYRTIPNGFALQFHTPNEGSVTLSIIDQKGRLLHRGKHTLQSGNNSCSYEGALATGLYFVTIDGTMQRSMKLLVP